MNPRKLSLYCDEVYEHFTLLPVDGGESQQFDNVREALQFAAGQITEQSELIVYSQLGKEIVRTTISPAMGVIHRESAAEF